ncbi:hypothetical protein [Alcaligenes faecalis]|uniref:hypothetical protein n=1 Tax=Alcaligenes faecalis TaxID=511 RepID=UPI0013DDE0D9|nr:hypothetical protein [Alcaligenes faecalis]
MQTIDENFGVYKSNEALIDENASEVMLTKVNKMLSLVCVRINNAVYCNRIGHVQRLNINAAQSLCLQLVYEASHWVRYHLPLSRSLV